ncbi:hypothetical protein HmCmsJML016_01471 [Escherichia coli]|nr:hypothetical protein HmCmsJML016_01471 [Escherichia coli]GDX02895.1 hypothetical protein ExPUPEC61_00474 [Escherichia coli]
MANWILRIASSFSNRSPGSSPSAKATSRLVIPAEAERTTKRTLASESTISALRFMASKSATLVPPNLETTISDITTSCQGIHFQPWHKGRAEDGWAQSDTSLLFSPRSAPPLAKRPTANASGDNPGDSAPVADDERSQPFNHLGDAPPQVLSQDWLLQHRYLGNAPLLACASAGSTFINKG